MDIGPKKLIVAYQAGPGSLTVNNILVCIFINQVLDC